MELRRVNRDEVPKSQRWQKSAVWDIESAVIKNWLEDKANAAVGKVGVPFEQALQAGPALSAEVNATFAAEGQNRDPRLMNEADLGHIEREAPSPGVITVIGFFKYLCMSLEMLIFGWMWYMGLANYIAIILGALLAGGGAFAGWGSGRLVVRNEKGENLRDILAWVLLVIGTGIIVAVSWLRSYGEEEGTVAIVTITASLAVAIAIAELFHYTLSARYREQREKMFLCQQWFSTDRCTKEFENGLWEKLYENSVRALWKSQTRFATSGPVAAAPSAPDARTPGKDTPPRPVPPEAGFDSFHGEDDERRPEN